MADVAAAEYGTLTQCWVDSFRWWNIETKIVILVGHGLPSTALAQKMCSWDDKKIDWKEISFEL